MLIIYVVYRSFLDMLLVTSRKVMLLGAVAYGLANNT